MFNCKLYIYIETLLSIEISRDCKNFTFSIIKNCCKKFKWKRIKI